MRKNYNSPFGFIKNFIQKSLLPSVFSLISGKQTKEVYIKNSFLSLLLTLLLASQVVRAQDTSLIKYLPLRVGNIWVYYGIYNYPFGMGTYYDRYKLTGTIQRGGHIYYTFNHLRVQLTGNVSGREIKLFKWGTPIRVDSVIINVYKDTNCYASMFLVDSLKARKNDSASICNYIGGISREVCTDTSFYNICGANRKLKTFYAINGIEGGEGQTYVKDIGVVSGGWFQHQENVNYTLRGSVINGVVCGDTSLTGISPISNEVPSSFQLYQNYPNPFNSVTKIRFDIPQSLLSFGEGHGVRLNVYDLLGREVTTLVNEQLNPGTYEVEWDATNFPSGVYFYKLSTEFFSQTERMVLIK